MSQPSFENDPATRRLPGQLPAERLARLAKTPHAKALTRQGFLPYLKILALRRNTDLARINCIHVLLATQAFQRVHGHFPESVDQLTPDFLPQIPLDPHDQQERPLQYRRLDDGSAVVYSVGDNQIDDQGDLDFGSGGQPTRDIGYRIQLKKP